MPEQPQESPRAREEAEPATPDDRGHVERGRRGFLVVGIGASAGGLQALEAFFERVGEESGIAYVVVTHQHPGHSNLLPELLGRRTRLPVSEVPVEGGVRIEPDRVYLSRPGTLLHLQDGVLRASAQKPAGARSLPIDHFFRSLAADQGPRAAAVILSGTGTDGTEGIKLVKHEAGIAIAQDEASAEHAGMLRSAVGTGLVDYVLPPEQIPERLLAHARGLLAGESRQLALPEEVLQRLLALLHQATGHDFSAYKRRTVERRIERRIRLHQLADLREYLALVQAQPQELEQLFQELLIGVTSFFREPEAFQQLTEGLRELLRAKPDGYLVRVWVPGCSTGEEAYTLAILLDELCQELDRGLSMQVFATDVNPRAIEVARAGRYPEGIAAHLSPERLRRYFQLEDGIYQINKALRERLVFAPQDVLKDPPFTRLDLVSCRNLLIYLQPELQRRLLPVFHYALKADGLLLLGSSESIGSFEELFEPLDKKHKLFRRRDGSSPVRPLSDLSRRAEPSTHGREGGPRHHEATRVGPAADRLILEVFAPACLLVTDRGEIAHVRGRTGAYLEPAEGHPTFNALNMAREGLGPELALALRQAASEQQPVVRRDVRVRTNGAWSRIDLSVQPVTRRELRGLYLVSFQPLPDPDPDPDESTGPKPRRPDPLEEELQRTKESLQATVEELEASNEELKSTNEELQSTNEELQSTNEELETSKEEMQSLNEELQTVNAELEGKISELSQANDDMSNLLNSTKIATVFLDRRLHIKRFTPQAKLLIKLIESDVGRPISDLSSRLEYAALTSDAEEVLRTLVPRELEVRSEGGEWFLTRLLPYRTAEDRLDGVVITFVDVSDSHRALETVAQTAWEPLLVLDAALRVLVANQAFYRAFDLQPEQVQGRAISALPGSSLGGSELRRLLEEVLPRNQILEGYEMREELPGGATRVRRLNARRLEPRRGAGGRIVLAFHELAGPQAAEGSGAG